MYELLTIQQLAAISVTRQGAVFEVNNSTNPDSPMWQQISHVHLGCDILSADDYDCDGHCLVTLHIVPIEDGDPTRWHMTAEQALSTQFRVIG